MYHYDAFAHLNELAQKDVEKANQDNPANKTYAASREHPTCLVISRTFNRSSVRSPWKLIFWYDEENKNIRVSEPMGVNKELDKTKSSKLPFSETTTIKADLEVFWNEAFKRLMNFPSL